MIALSHLRLFASCTLRSAAYLLTTGEGVFVAGASRHWPEAKMGLVDAKMMRSILAWAEQENEAALRG
jgi:hypothetical protein